jgi:hypothetical protein
VELIHISISFTPSSRFITLPLTHHELKGAIKSHIMFLMHILTGEVKSVGEIPPPINCAACVEVAVPEPTL